MDIEKFRTFIAASRCSSFYEAANRLFITPSTVSKHISALEDEFGVTLFHRTSGKLEPTKEGLLCLCSAEKIVEEYDNLYSCIASPRERKLHISTIFDQQKLLHVMKAFYTRYPDIKIELEECHGNEVVRNVLSGKYALGFANDHRGFELRNSMFKGCAYAKDITCISEGNRSCAVFEGFFDLLSFKQYAREHPEMPALGKLDVCVLNSTAIVDRSKDFLSKYEKVHAFLDNDAPGRGALGKIRSFLPEDVILVNESERLSPRCNDFNEFLQKTGCPAAGHEI